MNESSSASPRRGKRPANKAAQFGAGVGMIVGIVVFNAVAPQYFPPPVGGGINWVEVVWAGLVGGISAGLGAMIATLISGASGGRKPPQKPTPS